MRTATLLFILLAALLLIWLIATVIIIIVLISKNKNTNASATVVNTYLRCTACGEIIPNGSQFCPKCGTPANNAAPFTGNAVAQDGPSAGFAVLGFFFPLIGLILYLVWKDQTPLKAKSSGMGALTGFISSVVFSILFVIIYVVFILGIFSMYM